MKKLLSRLGLYGVLGAVAVAPSAFATDPAWLTSAFAQVTTVAGWVAEAVLAGMAIWAILFGVRKVLRAISAATGR